MSHSCLEERETERDRGTDRQTDRQTDIPIFRVYWGVSVFVTLCPMNKHGLCDSVLYLIYIMDE